MKKLSAREYAVFAFIRQYILDHVTAPTRREIAEAFSITPAGAQWHVQRLNKKGFITLVEGKRNIRLKKKHYRIQKVLFEL